jgi:hypothetical protein
MPFDQGHVPSTDSAMRYLCLVYHEEEKLKALGDADLCALVEACGEWVVGLERAGRHAYSAGLQSIRSATTLRRRNGRLQVTDGPFAETKEVLGGFTVIEARDLNEAIRIASQLPAVRIGSVEVRPVLEPGVHAADPLDARVAAAMEGRRVKRTA